MGYLESQITNLATTIAKFVGTGWPLRWNHKVRCSTRYCNRFDIPVDQSRPERSPGPALWPSLLNTPNEVTSCWPRLWSRREWMAREHQLDPLSINHRMAIIPFNVNNEPKFTAVSSWKILVWNVFTLKMSHECSTANSTNRNFPRYSCDLSV